MSNVQMSKVVEKAQDLDMNVENVKLELKKIQSIKCRLAKQKAKSTYETEMREVVAHEQLLKEVRAYLTPVKMTVTTISQEQVDLLSYDDTIKAIKSIQSKKCNTKWLTPNEEDNVEYQDALRIEKMLLEHKSKVKPIEDNVVKKSDVELQIDAMLEAGMISQEAADEMKSRLIK